MPHLPSEGKGALFPQDQSKKKHPKAPDWKGELMVKGEVVKLSAWIKKSKYGEFLSLAVDTWRPGNRPQQQYPKDVTPDLNDDVPF